VKDEETRISRLLRKSGLIPELDSLVATLIEPPKKSKDPVVITKDITGEDSDEELAVEVGKQIAKPLMSTKVDNYDAKT
jgi:hypothetical protein